MLQTLNLKRFGNHHFVRKIRLFFFYKRYHENICSSYIFCYNNNNNADEALLSFDVYTEAEEVENKSNIIL